MESELFAQVLAKIKEAQAQGEIGPERQAALTRMFTEFMAVYNQPDGSLEQMAAKQKALRALVDRYKDTLINPQLGNT